MVASALNDRNRAGIAYGEALAGDAAEIAFALDRAVQHGVADDESTLRNDFGLCRRRTTIRRRKGLADIIVGVAFRARNSHRGRECAKALAGGAFELRHDGVGRQAVVAVTLGNFARQHGADGAVGIPDRQRDAYRRAALQRALRLRDQLAVDDVVDLVILSFGIVCRHARRHVGLGEQLGEIKTVRLGMGQHFDASSICIWPIISLKVR